MFTTIQMFIPDDKIDRIAPFQDRVSFLTGVVDGDVITLETKTLDRELAYVKADRDKPLRQSLKEYS